MTIDVTFMLCLTEESYIKASAVFAYVNELLNLFIEYIIVSLTTAFISPHHIVHN